MVLESQSLRKEEKAGMEKDKKENRKHMKTMKWNEHVLHYNGDNSHKRVHEESRPGFPKQSNTLILGGGFPTFYYIIHSSQYNV